jgi:pyruvate-formate lyase-activating enzyme
MGGIYASLMPDHARQSGADEIFIGTNDELDSVVPDYELLPEWKANLVFTSRGCIRKCKFCAVPAIEPIKSSRNSFGSLLDARFNKIIFWDNNFFGTPNWREILEEIRERNLVVDFNQGIDARLVTEEVAEKLVGIKISPVRMAYDSFNPSFRKSMERAIRLLGEAGFRKRNMMVYVLHNFTDSPEDFLQRVRDLLNWGVVAYPMRFEPLQSLEKNKYVAQKYGWTEANLNLIARARRVIGFGGAFPPYEGLRKKLDEAPNFQEAFKLRPVSDNEDETFANDPDLITMGDDHEFPNQVSLRSAAA